MWHAQLELIVGRSRPADTHRKQISVPPAPPAPGPYRMNAPFTRLERHERGILSYEESAGSDRAVTGDLVAV